MPTPTAADSAASGGSSPSDVTLTDAVVRTDLGRRPNPRHEAQRLLPTPTAFAAACEADAPARARSGAGPGLSQVIVHNGLLATPRATDGTKGGPSQHGSSGDLMPPSAVYDIRSEKTLLPTPMAATRDRTPEEMVKRTEKRVSGEMPSSINLDEVPFFGFGDYAPAIARWEDVLGRPAPAPTEPTGKGGAPRLSPAFVEWLMGLPAGHVTDVDISRNAQLKALGNGVVPQQAAAAARWWLAQIKETAA